MNDRLLLDSNVLLWSLQDRSLPRLKPAAREAIELAPEVLVSVVSPWELMIKAAKDRLSLPVDFQSRLKNAGYTLVEIAWEDARLAAFLPRAHKDPFDRMIIAQAINRNATVITSDALFDRYGVNTLRT